MLTTFQKSGDETDMAKRSITSQELLGGAQELTVIHAGEEYRLRITSNNRLIHTK